jgi:peptidyl-Lys metalloendopeptidase
MKRRHILVLLVIPLLLAGSPPAFGETPPASRFPSTLTAAAQYRLGEPITLTFELRNDSGRDHSMLAWDTPLENLDGEVLDYVRVRHAGQDLPYEGRAFKRADPDASDYRLIRSGEQVRERIDLTTAFAFTEPGEYTVTLDTRIRDAVPTGSPPGARQFTQVALGQLSVTFQVLPGGKARPTGAELARQGTKSSPGVEFIGGTAEQHQEVHLAVDNAEQYVRDAIDELSSQTSERYVMWFGEPDHNRHQTVVTHFNQIAGDSLDTTYDLVTCDREVYAYVYPDNDGMVYLCSKFWQAPVTGTDSKAGTLVHEQSHFTVNGRTEDHVYHYDACLELARNDPDTAVMNADSHEYFAENSPAQP